MVLMKFHTWGIFHGNFSYLSIHKYFDSDDDDHNDVRMVWSWEGGVA